MTAEQIGLAAMRWRRLDLVALELESRTSATIFARSQDGSVSMAIAREPSRAQQKIDKAWKLAAKSAADAHDEFMALLAEATPEPGEEPQERATPTAQRRSVQTEIAI